MKEAIHRVKNNSLHIIKKCITLCQIENTPIKIFKHIVMVNFVK